jgi:lipoprotein-anchoring transpeptidase ErfK/SrfK
MGMVSRIQCLWFLAFAIPPFAANAQTKSAQPALTKADINDASLPSEIKDEETSPSLVKAQVLLARWHASPGVIDGRNGDNMRKALSAFESTHDLPQAAKLDDKVWTALTQDQSEPVMTDYEITKKDTEGPFTPEIPNDYGALAKLNHLNYRNPVEMFAERFHMDETLLKALNPEADFGKAGEKIVVANIQAKPLTGKIAKIDVDKDQGQVRALDHKGKLVIAFPATVGSDELPSPTGDYKVKGVAWSPKYSYDPKKNFQQGKNTKKLSIPAGPNNPVGSVYIALSKPTYGIHGTPEPSKIDKTSSHGCVRLTNWDAEELAHMVRGGIPVHFM